MTLYCIVFMRCMDDDNTEHSFFAYALTEQKAKQRFVETTGYNKGCIVSIHRVEE